MTCSATETSSTLVNLDAAEKTDSEEQKVG